MTIGKKLTIGFASMLAAMLIMSYAAWSTIGSMKRALEETTNTTARGMILAESIKVATADMRGSQRGMIMLAGAKDSARSATAKQEFRKDADMLRKSLTELTALSAQMPETLRILGEMNTQASTWDSVFAELDSLCAQGRSDQAAQTAIEKAAPLYASVAQSADRLIEFGSARIEADKKNVEDLNRSSRMIMLGLLVLAVGIGGAVLYVLRNINSTLHRVAGDMAEVAGQVSSAAAQVSASSQELARGASEQAAALEETSASSEEISTTTNRNADHSQEAATLMAQGAREVTDANRKLEQMLSCMKEITGSSEKISKIIKVIDEIAFQTNILALNAAVEAARAGEAGMGFAVVADEVRNLAQRCAQAARDTTGLIEESITTTSEGSTRLNEVAQAVTSITETSLKVKEMVEGINSASHEQARGIEQVSKAIAQMEQVTQRAAANAEESAAASEELSAQAEAMDGSVKQLRSMVGGSADHGQPSGSVATFAKPRVRDASEAARSLSALGKAVHHETTKPARAAAAVAPAGRGTFPLDDDFKEF